MDSRREMEVRQCPYCLELYPLNAAWFNITRGRYGWKCRPCRRLAERQMYDKTLPEGTVKKKYGPGPFNRLEYARTWRDSNRAAVSAYHKAYHEQRKREKFAKLTEGLR